MMKENNCQLRILYPREGFFRKDPLGGEKSYFQINKLIEFVSSRPALKEIQNSLQNGRKLFHVEAWRHRRKCRLTTVNIVNKC